MWLPVEDKPFFMMIHKCNTHLLLLNLSVLHHLTSPHRYDFATNTWSMSPSCCSPYHGRMLIGSTVHQNKLYMIGGSETYSMTTCHYFDGEDEKWYSMPPLPHAVAGAAVVVVDDQLCVFGGRDEHQSCLQRVQRYSLKEKKWTSSTT